MSDALFLFQRGENCSTDFKRTRSKEDVTQVLRDFVGGNKNIIVRDFLKSRSTCSVTLCVHSYVFIEQCFHSGWRNGNYTASQFYPYVYMRSRVHLK